MGKRRPLVLIGGRKKELPANDYLAGIPIIYPTTIRNCNNTGTEVFVIEFNIPAGSMANGELLKLAWVAQFRNLAGDSPTLATKIHIGGTSVALAAADGVGTGLAFVPYEATLWRIDNSLFVQGWESGYGYHITWHPAAINAITGSDIFSTAKKGGEVGSLDFDTDITIKIGVQWSSGGDPRFYTVKGARAWKI